MSKTMNLNAAAVLALMASRGKESESEYKVRRGEELLSVANDGGETVIVERKTETGVHADYALMTQRLGVWRTGHALALETSLGQDFLTEVSANLPRFAMNQEPVKLPHGAGLGGKLDPETGNPRFAVIFSDMESFRRAMADSVKRQEEKFHESATADSTAEFDVPGAQLKFCKGAIGKAMSALTAAETSVSIALGAAIALGLASAISADARDGNVKLSKPVKRTLSKLKTAAGG